MAGMLWYVFIWNPQTFNLHRQQNSKGRIHTSLMALIYYSSVCSAVVDV